MPEGLTPAHLDPNDPALMYLNLHPQEEIKYVIRHHWAGFLGTIGIVLALVLFPILLILVANLALNTQIGDYATLLTVAIASFYIFLFTFLFGAWINYYFDIIFITNQRIININQQGLLSRQNSELTLDEIQNVTADVSGLLRSFFNFGTLIIETAGGGTSDNPHQPGLQGYFTINDTPNPNLVARVIMELHHQNEIPGHP